MSDDTNGNGVLDVLEIDAGGFFQIVTPTPEDTATPTPVISVTPTSSETPTPTATPTEIPDDIDYDTDTDSDGLPDDLEDYYGTDKNDPDTDNDGILDGYELMARLDPTVPDTDGDGLNDGDADSDGDGLTNRQECEIGCNPVSNDTDMDSIMDFDEVYTYGTSPSNWDTDGDKIGDYDELRMGLDPLSSDSDGNGIPDTDERVLQFKTVELTDSTHPSGVNSVTVKAEISGCMEHNTRIEDCYYEGCVSSLVDGSIGVPVDITSTGEFYYAQLIFEYDEDEIGDAQPEDFAICWIDYENGQIVPLSSTVNEENHTVSATVYHFSPYVLMDLRAYREMWRKNILMAIEYQGDRPVSQHNAFVVAVQVSSDVTQEQRQQQYEIICEMVENLRDDDVLEVIGYGGLEGTTNYGTENYSAHGYDDEAKDYLVNVLAYHILINPGETVGTIPDFSHLFDSVCTSFYHPFVGGAYNCQLVLLTNGNASDHNVAQVIARRYSNEENFDINVVALGDTDVSIMSGYYSPNNGIGISMSDPDIGPEDVLSILYEKLNYNGLWENTDSDSIPNVIEDKPILTSFGYFVNSNPHEGDTDGDNLLDSEELVMQDYVIWYLKCFDSLTGYPNNPHRAFIINNYDILRYKLSCFVMNSDPELADTDNDGAGDAVDATPMKPNEPVNYILFSHSDDLLDETARGYYEYISNHSAEYSDCILFDVQSFNDIKIVFQKLQYEFDYEHKMFTDKIAHNRVDNIVIIAHGTPDGRGITFSKDSNSDARIQIVEITMTILPLISCDIVTIDIEACYMGKKTSDNRYFANEFLDCHYISEVYGAYSASSYYREINMTFVFGGLWRFRRDSNNKPIIDGGKWLYSPMWRVR